MPSAIFGQLQGIESLVCPSRKIRFGEAGHFLLGIQRFHITKSTCACFPSGYSARAEWLGRKLPAGSQTTRPTSGGILVGDSGADTVFLDQPAKGPALFAGLACSPGYTALEPDQ